jgi:hypothetical protein
MKISDGQLFDHFVDRVRNRAAQELNLDVLRHSLANVREWGRLDDPHL